MSILTACLASIIAIAIIIGLISLAADKSFDKRWKKEEELRRTAEVRLNSALKTLCSQLKIPLSYHDELGDAAGRMLYHSRQGRLLLDEAFIEIVRRNEDSPYVLAHELGHYMAIKQREDRSEPGADMEAHKLCCSILTNEEQDLLAIPLRCYFLSNT